MGGSATIGDGAGGARDLRLDFFRGLALWFIFLNHIPANEFAWLSHRNYGISDATEMFVFISGYTASLVYAKILADRGFGLAAARVLHRCWTLYVTYIVLFIAFTAQVAYTARVFDNPLFAEEMGIAAYFADPAVALTQALVLKFRPANLDVLPLYIVLLLSFPLILPALRRQPLVVLALSLALYIAARRLDWNLPTHPAGGVWFFNPFAWQFLFVLGCALQQSPRLAARLAVRRWWLVAVAVVVLLLSLFLALSWQFPTLGALTPAWVSELIYPLSKTDLDPLRVAHFLALVYVTVQLVPRQAAWLRSSFAHPLILCGRHSLQVFCFGILLSFAGQTILVQFDASLFSQFGVTVAGISGMVLLARMLSWYQSAGRQPRAAAPVLRDSGA